MHGRRRQIAFAAGFLLALLAPLVAGAAPPETEKPYVDLGDALLAAFNPEIELADKGTLQCTDFISVIKTSPCTHVQIAFVLDGTDSMGKDIGAALQTVATAVEDLKKTKGPGAKIEYAMVVYRDTGSPSGPVVAPVDHFEADLSVLQAALRTTKVETGAPYFEEMVDAGVHRALELDWAKADDVQRLLFLCGDAPPYSENHARRRHHTAELVAEARAKGITINGLICNAGYVGTRHDDAEQRELVDTAARLRPRLQRFMADLADPTQGKVVNLANERVIRYLFSRAQEAKRICNQKDIARTFIDPILPEEIESARAPAATAPDGPVCKTPDAQRQTLAALKLLERAMAVKKGEPDGEKLLRDSLDRLTAARAVEKDNPFIDLLLANCCFNLARLRESEDEWALFNKHLERAYQERENATTAAVKMEVEADYALLAQKDYATAQRLYEQLTHVTDKIGSDFALRAHWSLAGMYLGDWGVKLKDNRFVDAGKAKAQVVQILARWQASPAADYFKVAVSGSHSPQVPLAATRWLADNIVGRQP